MISNLLYKQKTPYLAVKERGEIENYIATTKARRGALDEVKKAAVPAMDRVIARMRAAYPQFAKYHVQGFEKGHRDMVLLTYMAANAMFLGEHLTLQDQFTEWYRTILKSVHMSPQFLKDTYTAWQEELGAGLSGEAWSLLRPTVEHLSGYLANIPVPVRDEIGERKPLPPQGTTGGASWKS
jgi:hypothetical protein